MHDELDLPFGRLKLGAGGGPGGHNGVRSIIADARRPGLRAGARRHRPAGRPGATPADYVLAELLARRGEASCPSSSARAADAVEAIVSDGLTAAMNKFNAKSSQEQAETVGDGA